VVTVEEVVDDLGTAGTNAVVLPSWTVDAVVVAPGGARPSYAHGYYQRDNAFYTAWDEIARDRARFRSWVDDNIMRGTDAG
jgi:glutaconate CoA-transferase subunit A